MMTIRKRLSCLNFRLAPTMTVAVTRPMIREYTPRVKHALKAVETALKAKDIIQLHDELVLHGVRDNPNRLSYVMARAVRAEADAVEFRTDYLFDVVREDLGPEVARALKYEFANGGFVVK